MKMRAEFQMIFKLFEELEDATLTISSRKGTSSIKLLLESPSPPSLPTTGMMPRPRRRCWRHTGEWRCPIRQQQQPTREPPRPPRPLQCQRLSECESVFISVIDRHGNQRNNHFRRTLWIQCHFMWMMGMMVLSFMSLIAMAMLMMMLMWPWCLMMVFKSSIGISSGFPSSSSPSCWKAHGSVPSHWLSCKLGSNHGPRRSKYSHI